MNSSAQHPVLSVVMPCLNGMPHLPDAISSVYAAFPDADLEIILADGGSTDGSLEYLNQSGAVVLEGTDTSIYEGLNKTLARVRAPYIVWLNTDDLMLQDMASLLRKARESGADIATGEAEIAIGGTVAWRSDHRDREMGLEPLLFAVPTINSRIFARAALERAGAFRTDIGIGADREMLIRLRRIASRRISDSKPVYRYRSHLGSTTIGGTWRSYRNSHAANVVLADALARVCENAQEKDAVEAFAFVSKLAAARAALLGGEFREATTYALKSIRPLRPGHWRRSIGLYRAYRGHGSGW